MIKPKVLIAAPIGGQKQYSMMDFLEWISRQAYENYDICVCSNGEHARELFHKILDTEITDIHKRRPLIQPLMYLGEGLTTIQKITYSREKIRRYAVDNRYDYLFFMDTDTIPLEINTIQKLIDADKDVVSGIYFYKGTSQPVIIDKDTNTNISMTKLQEHFEKDELIEVVGFGFGCLMLSKKAFSSCEFNYDLFGEERSDDFGYCHVLNQNGFKLFVHPKIFCNHLAEKKKENIDLAGFKIPVVSGLKKEIINCEHCTRPREIKTTDVSFTCLCGQTWLREKK